jgi:AbrB family looped-hinge helix DNA binding protein
MPSHQQLLADELAGTHLPPAGDMWHTCPMDATLVMGRQGRVVIPAEVRLALGLVPGDRLHLHVAGPRLVLERQQDAVAELRALAGDVPKSRSFVEELLAERRLAADAE